MRLHENVWQNDHGHDKRAHGMQSLWKFVTIRTVEKCNLLGKADTKDTF